uniref:Putative ecdysteroid kinase n=1 Tax=Culex tarsalis TaxID=7177 RepID=A0A1Q3FS04_CULTA
MVVKPSDLGLVSADLQLIVGRAFGESILHFAIQHAWIEPFGGSPDGFLADHLALKILLTLNGSRNEELSLFVKVIPTANATLAGYLVEIGSFRKEIALCEQIIPKIRQLIPGEQFVPKYLLTKEDRLIVMENVKLQGYDILKGNNGLMDYDHLKKAFEALAHMHAGSILLEERESKGLMELYPDALKENAWTGIEGAIRTRDVENVIVLWCEFFRVVERNSSRLAEIIAALPGVIRSMYGYVKSSTVWRNVFSHGDLWSNNVMFKHSSSGAPEGCILVDFQLSRYTPPAYDLNMLLSLTSMYEFRSKHMSSLLDHYYEVFAGHLTTNGIDPASIYSKQSFIESCQYYRRAGQIHGCIIAPEVLLGQSYLDEVFVLSESCAGFMPPPKVKICLRAFQTDVVYRDRLLDMIQELLPVSA